MPANPFVYGEIAPRSAFCNRVEELDRLVGDLASGQKVFLISPRRYGKSSLISQALGRLRGRGVLTAELSVAQYSSYPAFLEGFAQAVLSVESRLDRVRGWLRSAVGSASVELRVDQRASAVFSVAIPPMRSARELSRLAADIFDLPAHIADERRRSIALALDEFQTIHSFDGGSVEQSMREAVQRQRRVGYVFAGSEPTVMERMIGARRPFYRIGPVMRLQKIAADEFAAFLDDRFVRSGRRPAPGVSAAIVELAGNLPYDVQRLAHETWDDARADGRRTIDLEDLHRTLARLLREQTPLFEARWQRLTLAQRAALRAVTLEQGRGMLSADVRARRRLSGPSGVQASLAALQRDDLIAREGNTYVVVDSLLREWVARRTF